MTKSVGTGLIKGMLRDLTTAWGLLFWLGQAGAFLLLLTFVAAVYREGVKVRIVAQLFPRRASMTEAIEVGDDCQYRKLLLTSNHLMNIPASESRQSRSDIFDLIVERLRFVWGQNITGILSRGSPKISKRDGSWTLPFPMWSPTPTWDEHNPGGGRMPRVTQGATESWFSADPKVFHFWIFDADISALPHFQRLLGNYVRGSSLINGISHLIELLRCDVGVVGSSGKGETSESSGQPLRQPYTLWIGLGTLGLGLYGSWQGFARVDTLGVPCAFALILISLVVMDGGMVLSFVALVIW